MEFKVGDHATYIGSEFPKHTNASCVITKDDCSDRPYRVEFEDDIARWVRPFDLEPIPSDKILITTDGTTTTARLYDGKKVVKSAEAKCSPSDKFDFGTGAKMAFDRLMGNGVPDERVSFHHKTSWKDGLKTKLELEFEGLMGTDKPKEAKPEPVKLYCVKSYDSGEYVTRGKIYTFDGHQLNYDGTLCFYADNFEDWKRGDHEAAEFLFPLVSRPAKVGEWVLVTGKHSEIGSPHAYEVNKIYKVFAKCYEHDSVWFGDDGKSNVRIGDYLVLDGYDGRYEEQEKPKGWNGKVVCVDNEGNEYIYTVGKVYTIKDGVFVADDGKLAFGSYTVKDFADFCEQTGSKFIEFKGEANER